MSTRSVSIKMFYCILWFMWMYCSSVTFRSTHVTLLVFAVHILLCFRNRQNLDLSYPVLQSNNKPPENSGILASCQVFYNQHLFLYCQCAFSCCIMYDDVWIHLAFIYFYIPLTRWKEIPKRCTFDYISFNCCKMLNLKRVVATCRQRRSMLVRAAVGL